MNVFNVPFNNLSLRVIIGKFTTRKIFWLVVGVAALMLVTEIALSSRSHVQRDCNNRTYQEIFDAFQRDGYAIFKPCSKTFHENVDKAAAFSREIKDTRVQDAWKTNINVRGLAMDAEILELLEYLHGRKAFPFQTLNFPVGTQQKTHSDVVHFDTLPTRGLMTAAWIALEDIHPDSGPLVYYPGSQKYGLWDVDDIGLRLRLKTNIDGGNFDYNHYELFLQEMIDKLKLKPKYGIMKKGEVFIWAASLLHGGSAVKNPSLTRLSQVTHYFMEGAQKYWVPWRSNYALGKIRYKCDLPACIINPSLPINCQEMYLDMFRNGELGRTDPNYFATHHVSCNDGKNIDASSSYGNTFRKQIFYMLGLSTKSNQLTLISSIQN